MRVIPIKPWRLIVRKGKAILKRAIGIDQGFSHIISATLRSDVGSVIVDVHGRTNGTDAVRRRSELDDAVSAIRRVEGFSKGLLRGVVSDSDIQPIAGVYM